MPYVGNNLEKLKKQNAELIRKVIYKYGPISRTEIAEILHLTPPTITTNVTKLIQDGLVCECEPDGTGEKFRTNYASGRKRVLVDFVPDARFVIGVERGYKGTLVCIVDIRGNVIGEQQYVDTINDYEEAMDAIAKYIENLLEKTGVPREKILGVGIGIPGIVDGDSGILRYSAINKWTNKYVEKDIEQRVGFACRIENNARCYALAEELFSEKCRPETFAYFLISRGLACPLVTHNRLRSGKMAGAGEVGHMIVDRFGPICPTCGNRGCLEGVASELAIKNRCIKIMKAGIPTLLSKICNDINDPQIEEIMQAQCGGDQIVCNIMEEAITYLGIGLANIINFITPPLVIVDGQIMQNKENQRMLVDITRKNLFSLDAKEVDIEFVPPNKFRASRGGAALAIEKFILQEGR